MKRILSLAVAAALGLSAVAATTGSASAWWRGPYGGYHGGPGFYGPRPGWGPGPGYYGPRPGWGGGPGYYAPRYYGGWYGNPGAAAAAGAIIGLGVGAAIAGANNGGYEVPPPRGVAWQNHVAYCEDRYRSYNPSTDTFTGYDGRAYRCVGSY